MLALLLNVYTDMIALLLNVYTRHDIIATICLHRHDSIGTICLHRHASIGIICIHKTCFVSVCLQDLPTDGYQLLLPLIVKNHLASDGATLTSILHIGNCFVIVAIFSNLRRRCPHKCTYLTLHTLFKFLNTILFLPKVRPTFGN